MRRYTLTADVHGVKTITTNNDNYLFAPCVEMFAGKKANPRRLANQNDEEKF